MDPHVTGQPGHLAALAIAGAALVSACSSLDAELAVVPGTPPPARAEQAVSATPPPARATAPRATADPGAAARDESRQTVIRLKPRPAPGPFEMNLYEAGDFVHQATKDWCVAGSTATMINIIKGGRPRKSVDFQERLYLRGRQLSPAKKKLGPIGVDLIGWAELLNTRGLGPYQVEASETRRGAIRKAAQAIRLTGRPVGLVTWRGAHSWVMSGFTATADPAYRKDFKVKAAYIQDTWYPSVSTIWGASDPPNTLVPMGRLKEDYLPYARPRASWPARDGKFMLILPLLPEGTVAR